MKVALEFIDSIRQRPNCVPIGHGPRHWDIFEGLCRSSAAKGSLVPDAYLAAIAIESGSEWVTTDRDYSRFDGLRWRHPFD
jgi:predicted nucleic acid-binding protein